MDVAGDEGREGRGSELVKRGGRVVSEEPKELGYPRAWDWVVENEEVRGRGGHFLGAVVWCTVGSSCSRRLCKLYLFFFAEVRGRSVKQ